MCVQTPPTPGVLTLLSSAVGQEQEVALVQVKPLVRLRYADVSTETALDDPVSHGPGLVPQGPLGAGRSRGKCLAAPQRPETVSYCCGGPSPRGAQYLRSQLRVGPSGDRGGLDVDSAFV